MVSYNAAPLFTDMLFHEAGGVGKKSHKRNSPGAGIIIRGIHGLHYTL